jgi:hypothetical protein
VPNSGTDESSVTVAAGVWSDDGDGTPESGEVGCGLGSADSFLSLKRASSKNKQQQVSPKLRREAKQRFEGQ